jgi:hypothetical protein
MPKHVRVAQQSLTVVGWLLAIAVLVQTLLAGRAIFVSPELWPSHRAFVHAFEWLSVVAVILAYVAGAARAIKTLAWLTVVLMFLQYATAGTQSSLGHLGLAAIHPVTGLLLFWTAIEMARRASSERRAASKAADLAVEDSRPVQSEAR